MDEQNFKDSDARDIGWAVKKLHEGNRVARIGWNGTNMFLFLIPGSVYYHPHVDMRTADSKFIAWTCSQRDLLATDWYIVELDDEN